MAPYACAEAEGGRLIEDAVFQLPEIHRTVVEGLYRDGKTEFQMCRQLEIDKQTLDRIHRQALNLVRAWA